MRIAVALIALLTLSVTASGTWGSEYLWRNRDQGRVAADLEKLGETPSKFVLYSLQPTTPYSRSVRAAKRFHDFYILGRRTEITDRREQRALLNALARGVRENTHMVANCFNPRHALHVEQSGRSIDLVICFECLQTYAYGFQYDNFLNSASPQPALMRHCDNITCHLHSNEV